MVALAVIAITFLVLLFVGLFIYVAFFILNKVYLNRLTSLMQRYNKVASQIHAINLYKIEILVKSNIPVKIDLPKIKETHRQAQENINNIYTNLAKISDEVESMNIKSAKIHLNEVDQQLANNEKFVTNIKKQIDNFTRYGDTIDELVNSYTDVYEELSTFFKTKIKYHDKFEPINKLLDAISLTISRVNHSKLKFEYKNMCDILIDIKRKIFVLSKSVETVLKFQIVLNYLVETKKNNDQIIDASYATIDTQDLQWVKKLDIEFNKTFEKFVRAYLDFDLPNANKYALLSCNIIRQINSFVYIHTSTQNLIDVSLLEIDKQTKYILNNKEKIVSSINLISKYFVKDPTISLSLNKVRQDLDTIEKLTGSAKVITSNTYNQKLAAIRQIATISKEIYDKKQSIKVTIENVNNTLSNVVSIIKELNNIYVYFWQLKTLLNKIVPESDMETIEPLINNNLNLINDYAKDLVETKHPNYFMIFQNITNMVQNTSQLINKLQVSTKYKDVASKLMLYANRYRDNPENAEAFKLAEESYKIKQYKVCIETLIRLLNKKRKNKNESK